VAERSELVAPPRIRPTGVWLIFLFYVLTSASGLVFQGLLLLGAYPIPPEQQAIVGNISVGSRLFGLLAVVVNLAAATSLWLLRKSAPYLFLLSVTLGLASTAWQFLPGGIYAKMLAMGLLISVVTMFSVVVGLSISVAIVWYVWRLQRQGVLR